MLVGAFSFFAFKISFQKSSRRQGIRKWKFQCVIFPFIACSSTTTKHSKAQSIPPSAAAAHSGITLRRDGLAQRSEICAVNRSRGILFVLAGAASETRKSTTRNANTMRFQTIPTPLPYIFQITGVHLIIIITSLHCLAYHNRDERTPGMPRHQGIGGNEGGGEEERQQRVEGLVTCLQHFFRGRHQKLAG